jgi:hypothetical protein
MENGKRSSNRGIRNNRPLRFGLIFIFILNPQIIFSAEKISEKNKNISSNENNNLIQFYEPVQTKITGNSCGPESDWPCMDPDGCLIIDGFKKKE